MRAWPLRGATPKSFLSTYRDDQSQLGMGREQINVAVVTENSKATRIIIDVAVIESESQPWRGEISRRKKWAERTILPGITYDLVHQIGYAAAHHEIRQQKIVESRGPPGFDQA